MSHFAVAVICKDIEDLDEILAPYEEGLRVAPYVEYTKAQLIEEAKKKLENTRTGAYAQYLADPKGYAAKFSNNPEHLNYLRNEFPKLLKETDEEIYKRELAWYEPAQIGPDGEVYSTCNPNSKWDWYSVGGRWTGQLLVKKDTELAALGEGDAFGNDATQKPAEPGFRWTDYAPIRAIEWDKMRQIAEQELLPYDRYCKESFDARFLKPEYLRRMYPNAETYRKRKTAFTAYAVIPYGRPWTAPGEMGWFGASSEEPEEQSEWDIQFFDRFIKPANPEHLLVMVDCHI